MIVFLSGDNSYAITKHIQKLRQQYAKKFADALEEVSLDLASAKMSDIEQALLAQPMFFTHRLVILRGLDEAKLEPESFMELIERMPDSTVAVLDGRGMDKRTKLFKALAKLPQAKDYPALRAQELTTWVMGEARSQGAEISRVDADLLVRRVGPDEWRLASEVAKLAGGAENITAEDIRELVPQRIEDSVFDLIAAVKKADSGAALQIFDRLMAQGASGQQLIATLQWQYRVMAMVVAGANDDELMQVGVKPYAAQRTRQELRGVSEADIARSFEALLSADAAIKSGEKKNNQAMTDLIIELAKIAS